MTKIKNRIFITSTLKAGETVSLVDDKSHYLNNVLRCKIGDYISLFNGKSECIAEVVSNAKNACRLKLMECKKNEIDRHKMTLFFSPIKRSPMEFMVQKCTEIGVTSFQPVLMERTNNKKINLDRLKLISIEACEQSSRGNLPSFNNLISFSKMIKTMSYDKIIFCSLEKNTSVINKINLSLNESIGIIIGPEGDFSPNEMTDLGSIKNSVQVTLGSNILKSETAGIVASSLVMNSIYND
tara:strand:- start:387 stop:1106 length:720 start_codon:yes stop_codon:yes gene_type:complete